MARPKSRQARADALAAAVEIVAESGLASFTVEEVVRRSGVAKTTIYRHWDSGPDLLFDALESTVEPQPEPDTGSLRGDLEAMLDDVIARHGAVVDSNRPVFIGLIQASADPALEPLFHRMIDYRRRPLVAMLQRARDRGEIDPDLDLELAVDLIMGPFLLRVFIIGDDLTRDQAHGLLAMLLRALGSARP